jgi:hypothetical protein
MNNKKQRNAMLSARAEIIRCTITGLELRIKDSLNDGIKTLLERRLKDEREKLRKTKELMRK